MAPKILVIDDDAAMRAVIVSTFARLGYDVRAAEGGEAGLAMFRADPADLVVTDIFMREGEGVDAILKLTEAARPPKIIAVSGGHAGFDVLQLARACGAHATALKPVSMSNLVRLAETLLEDRDDRAAA
jgi:DNA-binding NtrC family response regulator